jgi:hypothetical protein
MPKVTVEVFFSSSSSDLEDKTAGADLARRCRVVSGQNVVVYFWSRVPGTLAEKDGYEHEELLPDAGAAGAWFWSSADVHRLSRGSWRSGLGPRKGLCDERLEELDISEPAVGAEKADTQLLVSCGWGVVFWGKGFRV